MTFRKVSLLFCRVLAGTALALSAGGCKSSDGGKSSLPPSGRPEVALSAETTVDQVRAVAQDFFRDCGYIEAASRHRYEFVFDKPVKQGRSASALRVHLRLKKQLDGSWQFAGIPLRVEAWRSDLESEVVLPQGASQIQEFLAEIKSRVESDR